MPTENQAQDPDRLVVEIPSEAEAAAGGWLPPKEDLSDKDERVAKVNGHAEGDEGKPNGKANGHDIDALETIKRERDALAERLAKVEKEKTSEIESRDLRVAKAEADSYKTTLYAAKSHYNTAVSERQQLESAIHGTNAQVESLKREWLAAEEAGDKKASIEAQAAIAEAKAQLVTYQSGISAADYEINRAKQLYEQAAAKTPEVKQPEKKPEAKTEAEAEKKPEVKKPKTPDEWIKNMRENVGNKVADWLSDHREFVTNPALNAKFIAAAEKFAKDGKPLSGQAFIKALDTEFFAEGDDVNEDDVEDKGQEKGRDKPRSAAPPGAPVSRQQGDYYSSKNPSGGKLKLHPRLVHAAREIGSDPEVYANNIKKMIGEGKYPKNYLDWDYQDGLKK